MDPEAERAEPRVLLTEVGKDNRLVALAARSYYDVLLDAGCKIYDRWVTRDLAAVFERDR